MNRNAESRGMASGANDDFAICWESDTLRSYDIYYITYWQGMNSSRVLLLWKTDFLRTGVMEFIFSHALRG